MTPVSRRPLPQNAEKEIWDIFVSELTKITNIDEQESLLSLLLSPSERLMFAKRLTAFVFIDQGIPDSRISRYLNLTTVTVAKLRFAYLLSKEKGEPVAKIIQNPKLSSVILELLKRVLINYAIPALGGRIPRNIDHIVKPHE